jgi:hypothetical protein
MADVFISYARENQGFAERIAEAVRREGYSVFWDDDLPPHLSYGEVITGEIAHAKAAIVVWSRDAAASEWVRAEADLARGHKKLIQTVIDETLPPMPFNQIQCAAIGDWNGEHDHPGWRKVRASLAALSGRPAPVTVQPQTSPPATAPPQTVPPVAAAAVAAPAKVPATRSPWAIPALMALLLILVSGIGGGIYWLRSGARTEVATSADPVTSQKPAPTPIPVSAPRPTTALFTKAAVIDDPDGYANVRAGPAVTYPVVDRVNEGEVFTTYPQTSPWWQVRTADSRVGYMEGSRIRLVETGTTATAPASSAPATARPPTREASATAPARDTAPTRTAQAPSAGTKPVPNQTVSPQVAQMRRYCNGGPGQGTPQCRRFRRMMAAQQQQAN